MNNINQYLIPFSMKFYHLLFILLIISCQKDSQNPRSEEGTEVFNLPIIRIDTQYIPIDSKEDYVDATITIEGLETNDDLVETETKIKGRGNSTWWLGQEIGKKPYQIKFADKTEILGMPEDKKWVLLAELSDKSFIRNKIARDLGQMSRFDYTPQAKYVELYLNDEYEGLYLIGQKVEESSNRVDIGDEGYLIEIDQIHRIDEGDVYFTSEPYRRINGENVFNIKEPSLEIDSEAYLLIKNHMREFDEVLFSTDFANPTTGYAAYIDVDSFIDWFLVNEIGKSVDARWYSSIYFTYVPGEKIKMGPIWDFDLSFGNVDYADAQYSNGFWILNNPWLNRLYEDPVFRDKVNSRYAYYFSNLSEIMRKIDTHALKIDSAQSRNYVRWETLGVRIWPNPVWFETYPEEVNQLKDWITDRMNWLNTAL